MRVPQTLRRGSVLRKITFTPRRRTKCVAKHCQRHLAKILVGRPYTIFQDKSFELIDRSTLCRRHHANVCLDTYYHYGLYSRPAEELKKVRLEEPVEGVLFDHPLTVCRVPRNSEVVDRFNEGCTPAVRFTRVMLSIWLLP